MTFNIMRCSANMHILIKPKIINQNNNNKNNG